MPDLAGQVDPWPGSALAGDGKRCVLLAPAAKALIKATYGVPQAARHDNDAAVLIEIVARDHRAPAALIASHDARAARSVEVVADRERDDHLACLDSALDCQLDCRRISQDVCVDDDGHVPCAGLTRCRIDCSGSIEEPLVMMALDQWPVREAILPPWAAVIPDRVAIWKALAPWDE